jgi:hypothetical protein
VSNTALASTAIPADFTNFLRAKRLATVTRQTAASNSRDGSLCARRARIRRDRSRDDVTLGRRSERSRLERENHGWRIRDDTGVRERSGQRRKRPTAETADAALVHGSFRLGRGCLLRPVMSVLVVRRRRLRLHCLAVALGCLLVRCSLMNETARSRHERRQRCRLEQDPGRNQHPKPAAEHSHH